MPSARERLEHGQAGLGEQGIGSQKDGSSEYFKKTLMEKYPALADAEGFENMRTLSDSSKILEQVTVPPGGYNCEYLKKPRRMSDLLKNHSV